ncbi:MAG: HD domain-containing protein [Methylocystaceae bacterium]
MVNLEMVKTHPFVNTAMDMGNEFIGNTGAIEHNRRHAEYVARMAAQVLEGLGGTPREAELATIAGYLHDIGNMVNRYKHGMAGALMAMSILLELGMDPAEVTTIMGAIGNHEEQSGGNAVNRVAAAVILADKTDVHHSRVRKRDVATFTTRDRVNWACYESALTINRAEATIIMELKIDTTICSVMEYFEIFLTKMLMCKRAAEFLGCRFGLHINEVSLL